MHRFIDAFGACFGFLLAAFLFLVAITLFAMWVLSHNAPAKESE